MYEILYEHRLIQEVISSYDNEYVRKHNYIEIVDIL